MGSIIDKYGRHCGLLSPLVFSAATAFAMMDFRGYDVFTNYVSDLGVNPHTMPIFNAGILVSGVLGIAFSLFLWKNLAPGAAKSGAFLMGGALVFFSLLAIFTEQALPIHLFLAGAFFLLALIGMILVAAGLKEEHGRMAGFSLITAAIMVSLPFSGFAPIAEHAAAAALILWSVGMWAHLGKMRGDDDYLEYEWLWM
jgi:hypothetical membrane protein